MNQAMMVFFALAVLAWLAQGYLAFQQAKDIQKKHKELYLQYSKNCCIGFGEAKSRLFGRGYLMVVAADKNLRVVDCRVLSGVSVFDRMKRDDSLVGLDLSPYLAKEDAQTTLVRGLKQTKMPNIRKEFKSNRERALATAARNIHSYYARAK